MPRIHNLITLIESVKEYLKIDMMEVIKELNEAYIETRYPAEMGLLPSGKPGLAQVKRFYEVAKKINLQVESFLAKS